MRENATVLVLSCSKIQEKLRSSSLGPVPDPYSLQSHGSYGSGQLHVLLVEERRSAGLGKGPQIVRRDAIVLHIKSSDVRDEEHRVMPLGRAEGIQVDKLKDLVRVISIHEGRRDQEPGNECERSHGLRRRGSKLKRGRSSLGREPDLKRERTALLL